MKTNEKHNQAACAREVSALIKSSSPENAAIIAAENYGNFSKSVEEIAAKRAEENVKAAEQRKIANFVSASLAARKKPEEIVASMNQEKE